MILPLSPVYNAVIALLIIVPLGLIFFSSAFLYNKLCAKDLLTFDENINCEPLRKKWAFLIVLAAGMVVSAIFYFMLTHDAFDFSLPFLVPPLVVAVLCEIKNGFVPMISVVLCGFCVVCRFIYYCVFHGIGYGISIVLSFAIAFALIILPKIFLDRKSLKGTDFLFTTLFSLIASYFSPLFALIFVGVVYLIMVLGYEIPNLISEKRKGEPIFTFKVPILLLASVVFTAMLLI